jgi:CxxC motif-containing protein (DUF1111 family)
MMSTSRVRESRYKGRQMARWLSVAILIGLSARAENAEAPIGRQPFVDRLHPPSFRLLDQTELARVNLGRSVFDTEWAPAGAPGTAGRVGVGPLFNASSCNACHNEGERGRGPLGDGPAPTALVIQLEAHPGDQQTEPSGDPVYGRVFNTLALDGVKPEGAVLVRYTEIDGYYYPFGGRWSLRVPHYRLVGLNHGSLAPGTVIKPRLAPALFGAGLLEAVPEEAISAKLSGTLAWHSRQGNRLLGRFGWQGDAVSVRDQAANAFAREMGLTSYEHTSDDCTSSEADCGAQSSGAAPEVSEELLDAVVTFVRTLAVPASPVPQQQDSSGSQLFADIGCAACHRPRLPVELPRSDGTKLAGVIGPYTDLQLHDLGSEMADETASGTKVVSRWRTPPLWGLGYRLKVEDHPTFLHDGRARSAEEAILWHSGEAAHAKRRFIDLGPRARESLLRWLETL